MFEENIVWIKSSLKNILPSAVRQTIEYVWHSFVIGFVQVFCLLYLVLRQNKKEIVWFSVFIFAYADLYPIPIYRREVR